MRWGREYPTNTREVNRLCAIPPQKKFIWLWPVTLKSGRKLWLENVYWKWDRNYYDGHLMKRYAKSKSDLV